MSCSTTMTLASRLISRIKAAVRATSSRAMPAAGSSSRTSFGRRAMTMPISTHWRWPWARTRPSGGRSCQFRAVRSRRPRSTGAACRVARARRDPEVLMYRKAFEHARHLILDTDPDARDLVHRHASDRHPLNRIRPPLGCSWPLSSLKKVLLPAPFGPIRQRSSPCRRRKSTPSTARTPPKRFCRSLVSRRVSVSHADRVSRGASRAVTLTTFRAQAVIYELGANNHDNVGPSDRGGYHGCHPPQCFAWRRCARPCRGRADRLEWASDLRPGRHSRGEHSGCDRGRSTSTACR